MGTEDELLAALSATFPVLDRWRDHIVQGVVPSSGSDLERDDMEWRYAPTSTLAVIGLATAREHLHAIRLLVDAKELFPSATSTLARAALVGGAQTVWILAPSEQRERMRRSLSLAREDYRHHILYGEYALDDDNVVEPTPTANEQLERLKLRKGQVSAMLEDLGGAIRINVTEEILPAALAATTEDAEFRAQVMLRWRAMSGAAHSLVWPHFGHAGTSIDQTDRNGVGLVTVSGDVDRLVMDYFSAFHVASKGWRLLAERAGRADLSSLEQQTA